MIRLIRIRHVNDFELIEFPEDRVPAYGILSHTWGSEEVTLEDLRSDEAHSKRGYKKTMFCAEKAKRHGLTFFWVDTCCIDKSNSAELSEAIRSMYDWYAQAKMCFVYMSDVSSLGDFEDSRWFTRGWTLQELIAPVKVEFYSQNGNFLGTKESLSETISSITDIPEDVLSVVEPLTTYSRVERLKWAKNRKTTRREDQAYCLLGLLDISLYIQYGEKGKAYDRLIREIEGQDEFDRRKTKPEPSSDLPNCNAYPARIANTLRSWPLDSADNRRLSRNDDRSERKESRSGSTRATDTLRQSDPDPVRISADSIEDNALDPAKLEEPRRRPAVQKISFRQEHSQGTTHTGNMFMAAMDYCMKGDEKKTKSCLYHLSMMLIKNRSSTTVEELIGRLESEDRLVLDHLQTTLHGIQRQVNAEIAGHERNEVSRSIGSQYTARPRGDTVPQKQFLEEHKIDQQLRHTQQSMRPLDRSATNGMERLKPKGRPSDNERHDASDNVNGRDGDRDNTKSSTRRNVNASTESTAGALPDSTPTQRPANTTQMNMSSVGYSAKKDRQPATFPARNRTG